MTPRRILMIKGDYDRAGGPETLLSGILQTLDRGRNDPSLVVLRKTIGNGADLLSDSSDLVQLPWNGLLKARSVSRELQKLVLKTGAGLIHTHDMRSNLAAYLMGKSRTIPWIAHVHGWLGKTHKGKFRLYERIDKYLIRHADLVLVGSSATADEAKSYGAQRVEIVPNSVMISESVDEHLAVEQLRRDLKIAPDRLIIGVLGRVHPGKGQVNLIRAFAQLQRKLPNIHLLVVGDGPDMENASNAVRELEITDRVTFTGYHPDALSMLPLMEIVVVPSLKESLPLTALEAMSRKRCVIASRTGDLPRAIVDGVSGCIVEPGDIGQLVLAIEKLANNPSLRAAYGCAAFERIRDHYSMQSMSRRLESIYDRLNPRGAHE